MANDLKHLELVLQKSGKKRQPQNRFFPQPKIVEQNKANRAGHSGKLFAQANNQKNLWAIEDNNRVLSNLPELPKDKPLLIKIPPEQLDLDFLRTMLKMEVVCEYEDGLVIVATEPTAFEDIFDKIQGFAQSIRGNDNIAKLYAIVVEETKEERLIRVLSEQLYSIWNDIKKQPDNLLLIDTSIECLGTIHVSDKPKRKNDELDEKFNKRLAVWTDKMNAAYEEWDELASIRQREIENFVGSYNAEIMDISQSGNAESALDSFEMRIKIPVKGLIDFTENYPYIFEITFPDEFDIDALKLNLIGTPQIPFDILEPDATSPKVCVIDSGIQEGHVYLNKAVINGLSKSYLPDNTSVSDEFGYGGHGTRVAGAILYPNGITGISGQYKLPNFIINARILNENNYIPQNVIPQRVLSEIIKDSHEPNGVRIYNHSINANNSFRKKYMSGWAEMIDNLCFENDILFIQSLLTRISFVGLV